MSYDNDFQNYMKDEHGIETDGFNIQDSESPKEVEETVEVEDQEVTTEDVAEEVVEPEVEETEEEGTEEVVEVQKYKFKADNQEFEATIDELTALAQKGIDYTKKTQKLAKYRSVVELLDSGKLSMDQVQALTDALGGKKEAFAMLAEQAGIDPYDIDSKGNYKPVIETVNYELNDIISDIKNDNEYGTIVNRYVSILPDDVKKTFTENPSILKELHNHTQQGVAQKIMPEVIKQMAINPNQNFVELYRKVGDSIFAQNETKTQSSRPPESVKKAVVKKKGQTQSPKEVVDVWKSDEDFNKMDALIRANRYR